MHSKKGIAHYKNHKITKQNNASFFENSDNIINLGISESGEMDNFLEITESNKNPIQPAITSSNNSDMVMINSPIQELPNLDNNSVISENIGDPNRNSNFLNSSSPDPDPIPDIISDTNDIIL